MSKDGKYLIHFPAIYMLAYFRETRAFDYIIRIASLPDEQAHLLGDTITEDFGRILASVCDGNIEPIKGIIEDSSLSLIHPKGLEDDIRKAVADGKVMEIIAGLDYMECYLHRPVKEVLDELKEDESYSLISERDVYSLEGWVGADFDEDFEDAYAEESEDDYEIPFNIPFKRESFVGRNDPCPCGSGKKYKKCYGK